MNTNDFFQKLQANSQELLELLNSCTIPELAHKSGEAWSGFEVLEHILLTEKLVSMLLHRSTDARVDQPELLGYGKLKRVMVNLRAKKIQAPSPLQPRGLVRTIGDFKVAFLEQRKKLVDEITAGKIVVDNSIHKHPVLGEMTKADWLYFIPLHTKRHIEQIRDIVNQHRQPKALK